MMNIKLTFGKVSDAMATFRDAISSMGDETKGIKDKYQGLEDRIKELEDNIRGMEERDNDKMTKINWLIQEITAQRNRLAELEQSTAAKRTEGSLQPAVLPLEPHLLNPSSCRAQMQPQSSYEALPQTISCNQVIALFF
jgi:septal ring factor EnvC (AmiA/AmiB activator)